MLVEGRGQAVITTADGHAFTITAKADRIDRLADGSYDIIDYKTGSPPKIKQVNAGFAPQLPVEGLILEADGFPGIDGGTAGEMSYWQLRGGASGSDIAGFSTRQSQKDIPTLIEETRAGLQKLIATFAQEDTPYLSNPNPAERGWGEFDHLARIKEWEVTGNGD